MIRLRWTWTSPRLTLIYHCFARAPHFHDCSKQVVSRTGDRDTLSGTTERQHRTRTQCLTENRMSYSENNIWQFQSIAFRIWVCVSIVARWLAPPRSCPEKQPPPAAMHHSNQGLGDAACTLYLSIINKRTNNTQSMGQPAQILGVIEQLKNPIDEQHLVQALRRLKNDIIGHSEEKEAYLDSGIVPVLLQLLNDEKPAIESKVQVSQILCSFAHGKFIMD